MRERKEGGGTHHEVGNDVDVSKILGVGRYSHNIVNLDDILVADEVLRAGDRGRDGGLEEMSRMRKKDREEEREKNKEKQQKKKISRSDRSR